MDGPSICTQVSAPLQALIAQLEGKFCPPNQPQHFLQQVLLNLAASLLGCNQGLLCLEDLVVMQWHMIY